MSCQLVLMVSLGVTLLVRSHCEEARVRLNSINETIFVEGGKMQVNGSIWEPKADLKGYQCRSDLECRKRSYCHTSSRGPAHSRCKTCRKRKRHCLRDSMCCPTNRCSNNICVPDVESFRSEGIPSTDGGLSSLTKRKGGRKDVKGSSGRGQVGNPCLRSSDCSDGLCCARHFWSRICKLVLREGQVCTRHHRKGTQSLELFQRCPCGDGLICRTLRDRDIQPSSSPSSSLSDAAKASKVAASSSHRSIPHTSVLSSASSSSAAVAKSRLHVCQRSK